MTHSTIERTVLDNGITVVSETLDTVRSVALGLWFAVGSRSEAPTEAGMSHFLEHMMFKGTSRLSAADISESFDRLGAELNAFTSKEYTCYYSRVLDEHLADALGLLGHMVTDSVLADDAIVSEKEVVLEEIARHDDAPDDKVHDVFSDALWPEHPLGRPILGTRETVGSFDRTASTDYLGRHYRTGDLVVAAAGNVSHDALVALVEESLPVQIGDPAERDAQPVCEPLNLAVVEKDTEQAHIVWGVHGLPAGDDERFVLAVLDAILGGGMSSRLFQEIREKRGLAYAVYSYHSLHRDTGSVGVYCGTRPSNAEEVLGIVRDQVALMAENGVTDDELSRARESIKGHLVLGLENTRNRMVRIGKAEMVGSEILDIDEIIDRVKAVQAQHIRELADRLFSSPSTLALVGPFGTDETARLIQ